MNTNMVQMTKDQNVAMATFLLGILHIVGGKLFSKPFLNIPQVWLLTHQLFATCFNHFHWRVHTTMTKFVEVFSIFKSQHEQNLQKRGRIEL